MPSSATITAFYTFTANTKARASQVNTNFSNFRGHIVPIDPNTTTSVDNTYSLGATDKRWEFLYTKGVDFRTSTTTAQNTIIGDVNATAGAMSHQIAGTERFRVAPGTITGNPTGEWSLQVNGTERMNIKAATITGNPTTAWSFKVNGTERGLIDSNGFEGNYIKANSVGIGSLFSRGTSLTTTSSNGAIAGSSAFAYNAGSTTITATGISGSTCTVTGSGRPIFVGMIASSNRSVIQFSTDTHTSASPGGFVAILRSGTTIASHTIAGPGNIATTTAVNLNRNLIISVPASTLWTIDFPGSGTFNYSLDYLPVNSSSAALTGRLIAFEL